MLNHPLLAHSRLQRGTVQQAVELPEHLRDAVVGEHGDFVDVREGTVGLPFETGPEVGDEDLRAFENADGLAPAGVGVDVSEAGEVGGEEVDEGGG